VIIFLFFSTGCATVSTILRPPVHETKQGVLITGDKTSWNYNAKQVISDLLIEKQPLCSQNREIIHIKKKQLDGVIPALVEIPFFGFGIVDLVTAGTISLASSEETHKEYVATPFKIICGPFEPASGEDIMVQFTDTLKTVHIRTDAGGKIPLKEIRNVNLGLSPMNVFIMGKDGPSYIRTFDRDTY
jgi:hypothetical protein